MELWFTEKQTPDLGLTIRVNRTLLRTRSEFQEIAVLDTSAFGRILTLDGIIQTTERDEFVYHEMIVHVPLYAHPAPRRVLIVGGGDGGSVREVLKHDSVEQVVLVEIDREVINAAREFLPAHSCALDDPRCRIEVTDGIKYVANHPDSFDVVLVDSTDPVGPAVGLFSDEFYASASRALTTEGLFVAQTESPFVQARLIRDVSRSVAKSFPLVSLFLAVVPTYPSGLWSFTVGSRGPDPGGPRDGRSLLPDLNYYSFDVHRAAFALPQFVQQIVAGAK